MVKLQRQHLRRRDWESVYGQLGVFFESEVIRPVLKIIRANTRQTIENDAADYALKRALRSGRVQYARGVFSGEFSAAISTAIKRLGGVFDLRSATFRIDPIIVPQWVTQDASDYFARAHQVHDEIKRQLDAALENVEASRYDTNAEDMVDNVDEGWRASARKLFVKPELTAQGKAALAADYSNNLNLYIKKWLEKDIIGLRRDVQKNAEAGYRFDSLIDQIQHRRAVGYSKAKFLAAQETGLFMSSYRAQRFIAAGAFTYQWSTSHDARVRPEAGLSPRARLHAGNHRVLDGQIFDYRTKAPAQYMSSKKPCNPGEDFGPCRCGDIPLI